LARTTPFTFDPAAPGRQHPCALHEQLPAHPFWVKSTGVVAQVAVHSCGPQFCCIFSHIVWLLPQSTLHTLELQLSVASLQASVPVHVTLQT